MATRAKAPNDFLSALPLADYATQAREQWAVSVKQSQELTLAAAKAFADLAKSVPTPDFGTTIPTPAIGDAMTLSFDLAAETLAAQGDFVRRLAELFKPVLAV